MKTRLLSAPGGVALLILLLCAALSAAARAQDADPSGRAARLSDVEGSVSLQPAGVPDWTAATLNRPLTTGDRLWSDQSSRVELDIGDAVMRLGSTTCFAFFNLDEARAQMQVSAGTLIVRVRDMQASQSYEIDTPNLALSLQQPGLYRVDVNDAGDATGVSVSEGAAQAYTGAQTVAIGAQQSVTFTGTQPTVAYYSASPAPDDLDNWSAARDLQVDDSVASEYVASDIPGMQDLDSSGRWQDTPDYGYVWMPTAVVVGWVPYRFGHWVWITPWGWTWVDNARWGYAPFHYGRWVQCNNAWCWVPGPRFGRPLYAPALVGWVGGPIPGTPAAFGSNVGWFPLGPREAYVPAGRVSPAYLRNVNITNTTLINNTYLTNVNQNTVAPLHYVNHRAAAATTVPQNIFISGQAVGGHTLQLPAAVLAGSPVAAAAPALAPIQQSVLGPSAGRGAAHPPAALLHRAVLARTAPPRAPAPFEQQLAAIEANGGRPLARSQLEHLQPGTPATPVRVIAPTAAVITASALPHRSLAARAGQATAAGGSGAPAQAARPSSVSFADRERTLQQSMLPPAPRSNSSQIPNYAPPPPAAVAESSSSPAWRSDRPPTAPQYVSSSPQRPVTPDDPPHPVSPPSALPVFHPPEGADPGTPAQESRHAEERHQGSPPGATHATTPGAAASSTAHSPPPTPAQPAKDPRDYAAHGDRDSRERQER
jgi:hypothetical protein